MVHNLRRAIQKWARLTQILSREGEDAQTSSHIYLAVAQSVMLYGSDTWVLTPHMKRVLGGSDHRVARRLMGRQPRRERDGGWIYPPTGGCDGGGGFTGGGDLRLPPPEHSCTVYCDNADYGPMSGGKVEAKAKGGNKMVGTGGFGFGGDADGVPGGRIDGGV